MRRNDYTGTTVGLSGSMSWLLALGWRSETTLVHGNVVPMFFLIFWVVPCFRSRGSQDGASIWRCWPTEEKPYHLWMIYCGVEGLHFAPPLKGLDPGLSVQ